MDKEQIKKIVDSPLDYDESTEETVRSYLRDCFSKQVRWVAITFFALVFVALVPLTFSGFQFFRVEETQMQILYAAVFTCSWLTICILEIWAMVIVQKNSLRREIKRLELCIAELNENVKNN
ncbi:DUF6768 family protein [candidate division KSB1 bacterium]